MEKSASHDEKNESCSDYLPASCTEPLKNTNSKLKYMKLSEPVIKGKTGVAINHWLKCAHSFKN